MDTDEFNELIRKLNSNPDDPQGASKTEEPPELEIVRSEDAGDGASFTAPSAFVEPDPESRGLRAYLSEVVHRGGTALLLVPGAPPVMRLHGLMVPLEADVLGPDDAASALLPSLSAERKQQYLTAGSVDLAMGLP